MENIYKIQLYLSIRESIAPLFSVVQGDKDTRKIEATILNDDGTPFQNEQGITAEYWSLKPDGNGTEHSGTITATTSSFKVTVVLGEQDLIVDGKVYAAIVLKKNGALLATMPFYFKVVPIPIGRHYESKTEYQVIQETIMIANEAAINANNAARHLPYIRNTDQHWMVWDVNRNEFVDTGYVAKAHSPYINTENKHWMIWDETTEMYVDSGLPSDGHSPYIDPTTKHWVVWDPVDEQYEDSGVPATGHSPYVNPTNNHWMQWDEDMEAFEDTGVLSESRNPYVNSTNKHWMVWDHDTNAFVDSEVMSEARNPYINPQNEHWMVWDFATDQFVDSGVSASGADGAVLYASVQALTDANKATARSNIDAASIATVGALTDLTTDTKTNLVAAINEVDSHTDTNTTNIGDLTSLTTTAQTDLVSAVNEVESTASATAVYAKTLIVTIESIDSLPVTYPTSGTDDQITSDMVVINSTLTNPSAQAGNWSVNTFAGYLTVDGSISGSTDITLYLMRSRGGQ